jgi:signal transduction histidine kinase
MSSRADDLVVPSPPGTRLRRALLAPAQGVALYALSMVSIGVFVLDVDVIAFISLGVGLVLLPVVIPIGRVVANLSRDLSCRWQGVEIPRPYRPAPTYQPGVIGWVERCRWILTDPATWRDLAWHLLSPIIGGTMALFAGIVFLYGVWGIVISALWNTLTRLTGFDDWYTFVHVHHGADAHLRWAPAGMGVLFMVLGFFVAPALLRGQARWNRVLLKPTRAAELRQLRRIERDLHDGAQARLVAMGMNLSAAASLVDKHPEEARELLTEARDASVKALTELRGLVRGIHPPVLADRGLADAVRALALDSALTVEVTADLPGRAQAPVESAAYFAASELLTNVAKHAHAGRAWIDLSYTQGVLRMTVTDDGDGGADVNAGTGLRGVERRIGTFDGMMTVTSPLGGPTVITLEIPCALSSPKTSSS